MRRRLLVLQNAHCEHLGTLQTMFENDDFEIDKFIASDGYSLPDTVDGYNALVILGGPASVHDKHQYLRDEEILIKNATAKNIPILGICLGSQLLAKMVGGMVYRGQKKEIGWYPVELTNHGMNDAFKGLEKKIRVFQWHGDTYELPSNAVVLATSKLYHTQAFRVGNAVGVQFHLEVSKAMVMDWIEQYRSELKSVRNYISVDEISADLDNKVNALNEYAGVLYRNFRNMIT